MIIVVDEQMQSTPVVAGDYNDLGVWERKHIQTWVRQCPELLGEDLLIVTEEFDRFQGSDDRLDLLALDKQGNLVVIELKRDSRAGYADLQAIRYAAMVSAMTISKLLPYFDDHLRKTEGNEFGNNADEALRRMQAFICDPTFVELSDRPRIILCAQDFSQELTTSVLWLRNTFGVDISCVKIVPHKVGDQIVIVPTRIIPIAEADTYMVNIREKQESTFAETQQRTKRNQDTIPYLLDNGLIKEGDRIFLKSDNMHLNYHESDEAFHATITGNRNKNVKWAKDEREYAISVLTAKIFKQAHPEGKDPGAVNGNVHWFNEEGTSLWQLAKDHRETAREP